jgi:hypothetical protein
MAPGVALREAMDGTQSEALAAAGDLGVMGVSKRALADVGLEEVSLITAELMGNFAQTLWRARGAFCLLKQLS